MRLSVPARAMRAAVCLVRPGQRSAAAAAAAAPMPSSRPAAPAAPCTCPRRGVWHLRRLTKAPPVPGVVWDELERNVKRPEAICSRELNWTELRAVVEHARWHLLGRLAGERLRYRQHREFIEKTYASLRYLLRGVCWWGRCERLGLCMRFRWRSLARHLVCAGWRMQ